jgi:hypothetical protein
LISASHVVFENFIMQAFTVVAEGKSEKNHDLSLSARNNIFYPLVVEPFRLVDDSL